MGTTIDRCIALLLCSIHNGLTYSTARCNVSGCGDELVERGVRNGKGQTESETGPMDNHPIPLEASNFSIWRVQHITAVQQCTHIRTTELINPPTLLPGKYSNSTHCY